MSIAETPTGDEPGSDSLMGTNLTHVTELASNAAHDEANEEALAAGTEPADDGLPDAD